MAVKQAISASGVESVLAPYPAAVAAGPFVFVSGVRPGSFRAAGEGFAALPEDARAREQGFSLADLQEGQVSADSWLCHRALGAILEAAGADETQVLRQHIWQKDKRYFPVYERVRMVAQPAPAPSSGLGVSAVPGRGGRWIGLDAIAVRPGIDARFPARQMVAAPDHESLPSASHYAQAVRSGPLVMLAGHIPIRTTAPGKPVVRGFDDVPEEGRFLATGRSHPDSRDGPIAAQVWYTYSEIGKTLGQMGAGFKDIAHISVFLQRHTDFPTFHRVHRHFFGDSGPALCVTEFDEVGHKGCLIEIEPTAVLPGHGLSTASVPWSFPAPFAAPAARRAGPLLFVSGMVGLNAAGQLIQSTGELETPMRGAAARSAAGEPTPGLAVQAHAAFDRLGQVLAAAGLAFDDVVNLRVYLRSVAEWPTFEAVRSEYLGGALPACELVCIAHPGPVPEAAVQIDAIAYDARDIGK